MKKRVKRYLFDFVGILLILASGLLGWLPGPGGIPLLIAGLAILAIHNKWAENILVKVRDKGEDFAKILFPLNNKFQITHDIIAVVLLITAITIMVTRPNNYLLLLSFSLTILAVSEFIYNRNRISKLKTLTLKLYKNILAFFKRLF